MDASGSFVQLARRLEILETFRQLRSSGRGFWSPRVLSHAVALALLGPAGCGPKTENEANPDSPVSGQGNDSSLVATVQSEAARQAELEQIDPRNGPWRSEVFAEKAAEQLKGLAALLRSADGIDAASFPDFAESEIAVTALRPRELETLFEDQGITVRRGKAPFAAAAGVTGLARCVAVLQELAAPLGESSERRVTLKIGRVDLSLEGGAETSVSYDAAGKELQQRAEWLCQWKLGGDGPPLLTSVSLISYEEVAWAGGPRWFDDLTSTVFGEEAAFRDHLSFGLNHWLGRIDRAYGINYFRRTGLAIGDADGDGLDDLYLCQSGGLPNRLFLHQPDGKAREGAATFGIDWLDHTTSALFVDLDNDGDQDLVLAAGSKVHVLENVENKSFRRRAELPLLDRDSLSISAIDYDLDGDLDLFVCVGFADKGAHAKQGRELPGFVFHDARDGGRNVLFRNEGSWRFTDATRESGLDAGNFRHSLAASWEDFDRDGDSDLYIANDYGPNSFYRNDEGRFVDVAGELGVLDYAAGMSVSWGDYDRDGWMDLYVANMYSYAGRRIASQPEFLADADAQFQSANRRFSKGNSLFKNSASGVFTETSAAAGVERGRWAWGSLFADLNNDGWEDLFVSNGYITTDDTGDL